MVDRQQDLGKGPDEDDPNRLIAVKGVTNGELTLKGYISGADLSAYVDRILGASSPLEAQTVLDEMGDLFLNPDPATPEETDFTSAK